MQELNKAQNENNNIIEQNFTNENYKRFWEMLKGNFTRGVNVNKSNLPVEHL